MRRALLVLAGCASFSCAAAEPPRAPDATVAARLDGQPALTEGDISDWQAAQACYGAGALTSRRAALMRLVEAAVAEKAMARAGKAFSEAGLSAEAERIDRETQAPAILACIKKTLQPRERYLRVFVRPTLVESRLRSFLIADPGVQAGPRERSEKVLARVRKGAGMGAAARGAGFAYSSATYSLAGSSPFEEDFIRRFLQGLKPGELRQEPIESDYDFRLVRLLGSESGRWTFESASVPKVSQEQWFQSAPKMRLEIADKEMRAWMKGIKGNPRLAAVEIR